MTKIAMIAGLAGVALALAPRAPRSPAPTRGRPRGRADPVLLRVRRLPHDDEPRRGREGRAAPLPARRDGRDARRRRALPRDERRVRADARREGVAASNSSPPRSRRRASAERARRLSALIFLSAAGFVNATILQMPRAYHAMAEDGVLPAAFRRVDPRTQCRPRGSSLRGDDAPARVPPRLLRELLNYIIFTDMVTLVVVASTLFVLRRRGEAKGFRSRATRAARALRPRAGRVAAHVAVTEPRCDRGDRVLLIGWPLFRAGRRLSGSATGV